MLKDKLYWTSSCHIKRISSSLAILFVIILLSGCVHNTNYGTQTISLFNCSGNPQTVPASQVPAMHGQGQIREGSIVTIQSGAVYGGLGSTRGNTVPDSQLSPTTHLVLRTAVHYGTFEALLDYINSWVAVSSLQLAN